MDWRALFVCLVHFIKTSKNYEVGTVKEVCDEIETILENDFSSNPLEIPAYVVQDNNDLVCAWENVLSGLDNVWIKAKAREGKIAVERVQEDKEISGKMDSTSGAKNVHIEDEAAVVRSQRFLFPLLTLNVGKMTKVINAKTWKTNPSDAPKFNFAQISKRLELFSISIKFTFSNGGEKGESCTFQLDKTSGLQSIDLKKEVRMYVGYQDTLASTGKLVETDVIRETILRAFDNVLGKVGKNTRIKCNHIPVPLYETPLNPSSEFVEYCENSNKWEFTTWW